MISYPTRCKSVIKQPVDRHLPLVREMFDQSSSLGSGAMPNRAVAVVFSVDSLVCYSVGSKLVHSIYIDSCSFSDPGQQSPVLS